MVTTVRPIPDSYYYSGQGRLAIGSRDDDTGEMFDMIFVGNVTSLTVDIAVKKFEHKESMSGDRSIDLTIIQEKNATFKFTSESLDLTALAAGLYGATAAVAGATATAEIHAARRGYAIPLTHPNVTSVTTIATVTGSTALVENTDYQIDKENGTIYILSTTTVVDADPGENITITYVYGEYDRLEAFTSGTPPERFLRFEGLNTVNGDFRVVNIYRAAFDPLTGLQYINEELGSGEFGGNILQDRTRTDVGYSAYFSEHRIAAA